MNHATIRPFLVLIAALVVTAANVRAAEPLKPIRTIVYNVSYALSVLRLEQTAGFGAASGHGLVENRMSSSDEGTLTVAVVAAPQDGGLVTDVTFTGKTTSQPTIRVAIAFDGQLSYDPTQTLFMGAARLLPFLAYGLLTEHQIAAGQSWSVPALSPTTGSSAYRVETVDGTHAVLAIDSKLALGGPRGFDEHTQGTTTYATDVLAPITLALTSTARHEIPPNRSDNTTSHLVATQVNDSFQHR